MIASMWYCLFTKWWAWRIDIVCVVLFLYCTKRRARSIAIVCVELLVYEEGAQCIAIVCVVLLTFKEMCTKYWYPFAVLLSYEKGGHYVLKSFAGSCLYTKRWARSIDIVGVVLLTYKEVCMMYWYGMHSAGT